MRRMARHIWQSGGGLILVTAGHINRFSLIPVVHSIILKVGRVRETLRRRVRQAEKDAGRPPLKRRRRYPREIREFAVRRVHAQLAKNLSEPVAVGLVAEEIGCERETLRRWIREAGETTDQPVRTGAPKFPREIRDHAVRRVRVQRPKHSSEWATIRSVAEEIGCASSTLYGWVREAERSAD